MNVRRLMIPAAVFIAAVGSTFGTVQWIRTGGTEGNSAGNGNQPRFGDTSPGFQGQGFTQEAPAGGPTPTPDRSCKGEHGEPYGPETPAPSGITCVEGNRPEGFDTWRVPGSVNIDGDLIPGFTVERERP